MSYLGWANSPGHLCYVVFCVGFLLANVLPSPFLCGVCICGCLESWIQSECSQITHPPVDVLHCSCNAYAQVQDVKWSPLQFCTTSAADNSSRDKCPDGLVSDSLH